MARLSEIVLEGGRQRADAIRRQSDIEAERRLRTANTNAQAISSIGATFADAVNPATRAKLEAMKQDAELRGLQIQGAKDERAAADTAKQRQQALSQVMGEALEGNPETGHVTYNRERLGAGLARIGMADQLPAISKALDEADSAALKYQESLRDALAGVAYGVHVAGNDPTVFENEVKRAIANHYITADDAAPYLDAAKKDPAAIAKITSGLAGASPKFAELMKPKPTNLIQHDTTKDLVDEATGKVIKAGVPEVPKPPTQLELDRQKEVARHNAAMEAIARQNANKEGSTSPVAVIGPDGKAVYVRPSQAIGQRPASTREQGRPVVSGDANRLADLTTSLDDLAVVGQVLTSSDATGTIAKLGAEAPKWVTELTGFGNTAKQKQAVIDRVKQVIGKALEGGVLRKEDEVKYEKILPTIYDNPDLVRSKLAGLTDAIEKRRTVLVDSLDDAGYDVSRYRARTSGSTPAPQRPAGVPANAVWDAAKREWVIR